MIKMYGIPNCNTVKKAQQWLKDRGNDFEFHNFKKEGVTDEKLQQWFDAFGWEKVVNRAGLTFKKLSIEEKEKINNEQAAIEYLRNNTSAIKRPIVEVDDKAVSIGFTEKGYSIGQ